MKQIVIVGVIALLLAATAHAVRSEKLKSTKDSGTDAAAPMLPCQPNEIEAYNRGIDARDDKNYPVARKYFEAALQLNEQFPEAHNNLAYTLRMISLDDADASLKHYARALELAPGFPQALYYRAILYVQLDRTADAEADRATLAAQDNKDARKYADTLAKIIKRGKPRTKQNAQSIYGELTP